jgi:hypothetical protein
MRFALTDTTHVFTFTFDPAYVSSDPTGAYEIVDATVTLYAAPFGDETLMVYSEVDFNGFPLSRNGRRKPNARLGRVRSFPYVGFQLADPDAPPTLTQTGLVMAELIRAAVARVPEWAGLPLGEQQLLDDYDRQQSNHAGT